jgi:formamidopyrimidine-DNA glycosylase
MPELPEVETVRRGLERWCLEETIESVELLHPRAVNPRSIASITECVGARIEKVARRGKFLWFELDHPFTLVAHLGMSGQFRIQPSTATDEKHLRARFQLPGSELRFIDQRTFGWLAISELEYGIPKLVGTIAPDLFDERFDQVATIKKFQSKRSEVKRVLLDQSVMSGVGNIYADEALWRAKIHPQRVSAELSSRKIAQLIDAAESVMSQALLEGGTSFDSLYTNINGESGYFAHSLQAYGREDEACSRCHTQIRRIVFGGRSSHFCPKCQRL